MNSGLVSLIEGLFAQILYFQVDLRFLVVCVYIFCFSFSKEKMCWRTKWLVQDLIPPPSIYIHMCTLYTSWYQYVYAETESIRVWILLALQVCHPDSWAHNRVPHLCSVCECVRIHTHTPTYTPTRVKNREDRQNSYDLFFCQKQPPTPSNRCFHKLAEPSHSRFSTLNEQTAHTWAHVHILQRACTQIYTLMFTTPV